MFTATVFCVWSVMGAAAAGGLPLPPVTGKYDVGTIQLQLTDYSRTNPFASNTSTPGPRTFMVSLFYPAKNVDKYPLAAYMGPGTAEVYDQAPDGPITQIQPNSHHGAPIQPRSATDVILFSPGGGVSRHFYTTFAEDLASHGYLVVTIDHPYDAIVVEFPDGSLIFADPTLNLTIPGAPDKLVAVRLRDTLFTLNALHSNLTSSIPGVRTRLRIKETGMFGHSLGGATSAEAMLNDPRICGGINMDGTLFGRAVNQGLDKPFLLMGVPVPEATAGEAWAPFWGHLRAWRRALVLQGALHLTYTDYPVVMKLLGFETLPGMPEVLGVIDGMRANVLQKTYILAFFDFVLRGKGDALFAGPDPRYPEITYLS